jgi:DHA1 family bicyclomycin/chloramphenicol resistance-like MFS transporter
MRIPPHSLRFTIRLAAMSALPPLSVDMVLPALAVLGQDLRAAPQTAGLTLSAFLVGFSASQLVFGPLGDRFGRRRPLLLGTMLFGLADVAGAAAPSIGFLITACFFSGIGAGAGSTLSRSVVRDLFEGAEAQAKFAYVSVVSILAPLTAPAIGAGLLTLAGWRAIYAVQGAFGLVLAAVIALSLGETLPAGLAQPLHSATIARNFARVLRHRVSGGYTAVNACVFGMMFSYISSSPLVFSQGFGIGSGGFAGLFALTALGIMAGSFFTGRLARRIEARHLALMAVCTSAAGSLAALALGLSGTTTLVRLMPCLVFATGGYGMLIGVATQGALQPMRDIAGLTSGLYGAMQMLGGAVAGVVAASLISLFGSPLLGMTASMSGFVTAGVIVFLGVVRPALGRADGRATAAPRLP